MRYVLVEVIEREILAPVFFETFEAARAEMKRRYEEEDPDGDHEGLYRNHAYCENANHDNCDWKIFPVSGD